MTLFGVRHFSFATEARDARTELWIGPEALAAGAELMGQWLDGRSLYVVSTPRVLKLHGAALEPLRAAAARTTVLEVPEGEAAKTIDVASDLWRRLVADGVKRDSRLIAFGGGSVGDLGGFVAATTLRGIELALLPTTVLAQVDASIGGKTAIDLPEAKNAVGAFHPPRWVVGDTRWLATLDVAEARAGWVEAVKKAIAFDVGLFERFEEAGLERGYVEEHGQLLVDSAAHKVEVVRRDPFEANERRMLNLGHTLGHAVESAAGFGGPRHGECVVYGILFALRLAVARGFDPHEAERVRDLLQTLRPPPLPSLDPEDLLARIGRDKKAVEEGVLWVMPRALGRATIERVSGAEVAVGLPAFLADPWSLPAN